MGAWLKGALLALAAFGLCWGGAIGYWRATNRLPSTSDLLTWMLALPLALLALLLLGRKLLAARQAAAAAAPAPAVAASAPQAPAPGPALALLASSVHTPHGRSPEELSAAIADGSARAALDPELLDDAGYPVLSARAPDADDPALRDEFAQYLHAHALPDPQLLDEQWRALGMGSSVVAELAHQAAAHPHAQAAEGAPAAPPLRLVLLPGRAWTEPQRSAAASWLAHLAAAGGWPQERIAVSLGAPAADGSADVSAVLATLFDAAGSGAVLAIVLAFDSAIGDASVERMAAEGKLFAATRPQGSIPGEGAAGLLLADPATARLMEQGAPLMHATSAVRDASADTARRADAATVRQLASHAMLHGAIDSAAVAMVLADADHRTSRVTELMALATDSFPHLDTGADVRATGTACGACGAVPLLAALALAGHHAQELGAAVLCVSIDDPLHRGAVLVRPAAQHT